MRLNTCSLISYGCTGGFGETIYIQQNDSEGYIHIKDGMYENGAENKIADVFISFESLEGLVGKENTIRFILEDYDSSQKRNYL